MQSDDVYRPDVAREVFAAAGPLQTDRDYDVADLRPFGLILCTEAVTFDVDPGLGDRGDVVCGGALQGPAILTLHSVPALRAPGPGTRATPHTVFAWSPVSDAVYVLELAPASKPRPVNPHIKIVTAAQSAIWPDLAQLGVKFPPPPGEYGATVRAHGPYATIDEAVGQSETLSVPVTPPPGGP